MLTYLVSYDLNKPGQDYPELYAEIKRVANDYIHPCDSTWFIVSSLEATDVRDRLLAKVDKTDVLIVCKTTAPGAWSGLDQSITDWLKKYL